MSFFAQYGAKLAEWWTSMSGLDLAWFGIGMAGQALFVVRWFIQWLASERAGRLVVPDMFWYASLAGGLMVMAYGIYKPDPVIVFGQFGVLLYARNVYFVWRRADAGPAVEKTTAAHAPAE